MIESVQKLTAETAALSDKVGALALSTEQLDRRASRSEKIVAGVILGLLLDLILSVAVAIVLGQQAATNDRLQTAIQRETQTRQEVLCPLYSLIVGAYNPNSRPPGPARDEYVRNFKVIVDSYPKLNCDHQVTPGSSAVPR